MTKRKINKSEQVDEVTGEITKQPPPIYEDMVTEEEARDVEMPEIEANDGHVPTLTEQIQQGSDLSETKVAMQHLFPANLGNNITNKIMVGRIAPEQYMPMQMVIVTDKFMAADPSGNFSVADAVLEANILLGIGLDGKGRVDEIELVGAQNARDDMEADRDGRY